MFDVRRVACVLSFDVGFVSRSACFADEGAVVVVDCAYVVVVLPSLVFLCRFVVWLDGVIAVSVGRRRCATLFTLLWLVDGSLSLLLVSFVLVGIDAGVGVGC